MSDLTSRLAEPFDPSLVSWRVGSVSAEKKRGMALAYIDARDVMRRLDEVCGPENWQDEYPWSDGKRVVCRLGIKIDGEWVWKTDGAGDTDYEGEKGALSDAFKRAAVKWSIGRYLYDVVAPWVAVEQRGKTWVIADGEGAKLAAKLPRPSGAAPAPNGISKAAVPISPEEPPEVNAARQRIRGLIDKYQQIIRTAPDRRALELALDDGREEIAEIEQAGPKGKDAATTLRRRAEERLAQFDEAA